jgi:hypothetical protein
MAKSRPTGSFSLSELEQGALNAEVVAAVRRSSRGLAEQNVRHLVVGAIAVGVHGWPRATRDVDLLVAPEAWTVGSDGGLTARVKLPSEVMGVSVDYLPIDVAGDFLLEAFERPEDTEGVPIAPVEVVIMTKLLRMVMRDQADVVELVKAGLYDPARVTAYLEAHAPMLVSRFEALVGQAQEELEREG